MGVGVRHGRLVLAIGITSKDIIRDLAITLNGDDRVVQYAISSENFESIHSHNAYAEIERDKRE